MLRLLLRLLWARIGIAHTATRAEQSEGRRFNAVVRMDVRIGVEKARILSFIASLSAQKRGESVG